MKLYHGTTEAAFRAIEAAGAILPRRKVGVNNWTHTGAPSHPDAVYLTECYAPYFGMTALTDAVLAEDPDVRVAVIEIDAARIVAGLTADEDALEQATRTGSINKSQLRHRTAVARGRLKKLAGTEAWSDSLAYMGTCAHMGPIPVDAFSRVALVSIRDNPWWAMNAMQPSITRMNYLFCGDEYRALTAQAFELGEVREFNFLENNC